MKKKRYVAMCTLVAASVFTGAVVGCTKVDHNNPDEPTMWTVSFEANGGVFDGGATTYTEQVQDGGLATGKTPTRTDYSFTYWYRQDDPSKQVVLGSTPIKANETFYANWEAQTPSVTKHSVTVASTTNGTVVADKTLASQGETVTLTVTPASGYRLASLKYNTTDINISGSSYTFTMPSGNVTVTATFEPVGSQATLSGITVKTPPTKTSYIAGQTLDLTGLVLSANYSDGTSQDITTGYTASPAHGTALTTDINSVTITYNGKTTEQAISVAARAVSKLEWTGTLTNPTQYVGALFDASGLTFTATYNDGTTETVTPTFTSTYALDGEGRFKQAGNIEITASFGGRNATTRITLKVEQPAAPLHDITFDVSNTVTAFASHIDGAPSKRSVEEGSETSEPDEPTLAGFEFKGWYKESACTNAWDFATDKMGTQDITLYAKWEAKTYNVTYTLGGNTTDPATNHSSNPLTYTATDGDITLETPTREHYNFLGWYTAGGTKVEKIDYERILNMSFADIRLEARWQAKTYNITYELGGTDTTYEATLSATAVKTYTYGTARDLPGANAVTVTNKDGDDSVPYRFLGWCLEGTTNVVSTIPVGTSGDRKYVAKIEKAETWTFVYNCGVDHHDDGTTALTVLIVKGQKAENTDISGVRPGYTFGGWYDDAACTDGKEHNFDAAVSEDTEVYAKWTPIKYTIEYVGDGFTTTLPTTYTLEDTDINLTTPTLDAGYYFEGWYLNNEFDGTPVTKVGGLQFVEDEADDDHKIKIYAKTSNLYTVIYNANKPEGVTETTSGMPASTGKVAYGAKITKPTTNPNLTDYGFIGWYTDAACENEFDFDTAIGAADINATAHTVTLYAKWYEKPTSGKYIVGNFDGADEWAEILKGTNAADYKVTAFGFNGTTAKEWRIGGLTLKAGDEFKFVDYTKSTNAVVYNNTYNNADTTTSTAFYVRPGFMEVTLTDSDNPNYKISSYTIGEGYTWTIEFGTNDEGKTYITFTPDNYIEMRDPKGGDNKPAAADELEDGVWYLSGNFTDWFGKSEAWSTKAAYKNGTSYHFTKIYLKKYDTFKIMNNEGEWGTWLGGNFVELGTAFNISGDYSDNIKLNTIEDGYYNIVFSNGATKQLTITKWSDVSIEGSGTTVYVGDLPEKKHLVVTAGGTAISDYTILGATTPLVSGQNTIRILYRGGVFEHTVTPTEVEVVSMSVTKQPTTKWYWSGSTLSTAGMEITLTYNNGTTKVISGDALATTFDFSATLVGNSTDPILANVVPVTITLKENNEIKNTDDVKVNVVYKATSITATKTNKTYFVGDALDTSDISVTATYGTAAGAPTREAKTACTFTPGNGTTLSADNTSIIVTYRQTLPTGCTLTQPVVTCTITGLEVKVPQITKIEIDGSLDDSTYTVGDTFDATGLSFTATYENGNTGSIYANDLTFSFGDEYVNAEGLFKKAGTATLTVTCGTITATSDEPITVTISNKLTLITVDATNIVKPHTAGFVDGDPLSVTGIVVTAHYNEGVTGAVDVPTEISSGNGTTGYTVSPVAGTQLSEGANVITVSYRGQTATFTITAVAKEMTGIKVTGTPVNQYKGSKVNSTGLTFLAIYNNDEEEEIEPADITFTSAGVLDTNGKFAVYSVDDTDLKTITATYAGKNCTFAVKVINEDKYTLEYVKNIPGTGKNPVDWPNDEPITFNQLITKPANPSLKGYTFHGWYKDAACTTEWKFDEDVVAGDVILYAKWESIDYTIMYSVDGSTSVLANDDYKATANLYPELTLKTPPTKTGYDFVGWCFSLSDTTTFTRMTYARIPADATDTIKLYAKYEPKEYTVSFDLRGGTATEAFADQTVKYNESASVPTATPTRKHYDFAFWYVGDINQSNPTAYDFTTPITGDTTIYARWTAYGYTVQYNLNGGSHSGNPETYSAASGDVTLNNPTKEGYRFKGWKTATGATVTKLTASMLPDSRAEAIVLTADFELIVNYTVTFDLGYDVTNRVTTSSVEAGNKVTKPANPTRRGWKFEYWVDDTDTEFIFDDRTITADITLTAKWTQNTVKVYFNYNYGTTPTVSEKTIYQYATAASVKPTDPTRDGYEFMGWYTNAEGTGTEYTFTTEVGTALTLYAKWEKITGGKLIIGTDERTMYDNSTEFGDEGDLEYKLEGIKLNEGDEISFTIDGVAIRVNVDSYSKGINKPTGLQNSITLTTEGTFSFYLHKRESESNWTIYAEYAEYVEIVDGLYVGEEQLSAGTASSTQVSYMSVKIAAGSTLKFIYGKREVTPTIETSNGKPCTDKIVLKDGALYCENGGIFDMYYKFGTGLIWIEYKGEYTAPADDLGGLAIGGTVVHQFVVNEGGANELWLGKNDLVLEEAAEFTIMYGGANITSQVEVISSIGKIEGGKLTVPAGSFKFYYNFVAKTLYIDGVLTNPDDVDLTGYDTLKMVFGDKTITVAFTTPDWPGITTGGRIYVLNGETPVTTTDGKGGWPGTAMDGSEVTYNKNLADVTFIVTFEQGNTKETIRLAGSLFADGTVFRVNWGDWKSDGNGNQFYASVTKLA